MGKLRFREAPRPCSDPKMPGAAASAPAAWNPQDAEWGKGRRQGQRVCARVQTKCAGARPALQAQRPSSGQVRAGGGLRTPGPGAPVRFLLRIPGRGAGSGVGLQRGGGFPPSCARRTSPSPGWELWRSRGATESPGAGREPGADRPSGALWRGGPDGAAPEDRCAGWGAGPGGREPPAD